MPRAKPCPECGDLAEVKTYAAPSEEGHMEDLDVWECECGWAEDVEE